MKHQLFASLLVLTVAACDKHAATLTAPGVFVPVVTSLGVTPTASQVEVGRTITLVAVIKDQRDSVIVGKSVTWASNNTAVATVSGNTVTGVSKGTATITATIDSKTASITVFVVDPTVATVTITSAVPSPFYVGQTLQAIAVVKDGGNNTLTTFATIWTSSNTAVATVSSTGLITAVTAGTTTITATAGGKTNSVSVLVSLVPVTSVTLSTTKAVQIGRTIAVTVVLKNSTGGTVTSDQRSFVWASTDSTVATVTATGAITGLAVGTTVISCIVENKVGLLVVTVAEVAIDRIVVTPDSSSVAVGTTKQLSAVAFDVDSVALSISALNSRKFVWASSSNAKAVISSAGLVTAIATGTANMTATIGAKSGTGVITIP